MSDGGKRHNVILLVGLTIVLVCALAAVVLSIVILTKVNDNNASSAGQPAATTSTSSGPPVTTTSSSSGPSATTSSPPGPTLPPPSVSNSPLYQNISSRMGKYVNYSVNPCDDFYQHACGNYQEPSSAFGFLANNQADLLVQAINAVQDGGSTPTASMSLRIAQRAFKSCTGDQGTSVAANIPRLAYYLPYKTWPMVSASADPAQLDPSELWTSIAQLSTIWMTDTFITPLAPLSDSGAPVDTNWQDPSGNQPHLLYLDQATLYLGNAVSYTPEVWQLVNQSYIANLNNTIHQLAPFFNYTINEEKLKKDISDIANLEIALANISKSDDQRRNYTLMYNLYTMSSAQKAFPNVNWVAYFQQLTLVTSLPQDYFTSNSFSITEPDFISNLNSVLSAFTPRTIINYLGWRMMDQFTQFLPATSKAYFEFRQKFKKGHHDRVVSDDAAAAARACSDQLTNHVPFIAGRLLVDATFKGNATAMKTFQTGVQTMVQGILNGFRSMLSELPWMQLATLTPAYNKIVHLAINPGWPDWQQNDTALDLVYLNYGQFSVDSGQDWFSTYKGLLSVHTRLNYHLLLESPVDRNFFEMSPALVNAWYQPERNSISFPLAILNPPFYSADYPTALNLGGLGMVIGHELTHGFDDEGVQWDSVGKFGPWLDPVSRVGFDRMATCIQKQYGGYCPSSTSGVCVNGVQTQGENIADNGGMRAAFRAYKSIQSLNGPDARLPGAMSQYSQDQLFFLSFAQLWCGRPRDPVHDPALQRQLLTDAHAPSVYRVLGTLANFPQFAAAYNCPVKPHCNIWVGDNQ
uniref:Endothelin-converting enzyme 1 n=1 Tax=Plectus sambesii TaxID=2011161 RepID=A0A914XHS7_9BILA